ncbi:hypothetical protein B0H10DRAFT_1822099 [Mycena sp. CBHHK59/15]|nr:hypothetical protein B0H10DRAFT_1822099 [Mycena sp. CBHHK59/15]
MIFAGDFAQLPPVSANPLYCDEESVASFKTTRGSVAAQKNNIGKIIWHQVTTVVILKQNMRQTTMTEDDNKLRTALANMRYGACTPADIAYLESRTVSKRPGHPNFTDIRLRNVSVITGYNSQKDKINALGSIKFAAESKQELTDFYADDVLCESPEERRPKSVKKKRAMKVTHEIPDGVRQQLWEAWPSSTALNIAGKLRLCLGLPVMLRHNVATELCITKGQEGVVVGWQEAVGTYGQRILDTLFIELVNPPREVTIAGLPPNVVALSKGKTNLWCALKDDRVLHVERNQVLILPNFAMTDYASQGKSREFNVVDLNNCKTHTSYYTALSRSTS